MKHFLVTRFNLKNKAWDSSYEVLSPQWLDERFKLFKEYCLPSVKNQSNQDFTWLVYFDIDTPEVYKKTLDEITHSYSNFTPVFIDGFSELEPALNHKIVSNINSDEFVITTRLDNDDIIHKDFIKTIQELSVPQSAVIDLRRGYQLILSEDLKSDIRIYKLSFNPFLSIVSSTKNLETCISKEHLQWKNHPNIIVNDKDYLWLQLIHKNNKLNKKRRELKKASCFDKTAFGINQAINPEPRFSTASYNFYMLPYRCFCKLKKWIKTTLFTEK